MKKFWIVLLALGLVAAFAMSASAADVKFSGQYYLNGIYIDNPYFEKAKTISPQAFYHQRLRIQTEFKVAEGLSLVTRFDALETPWGDTNWGGTGNSNVNRLAWTATATTSRVQENIEFERAYIDFTTKIGKFMVGYQNFIAWGTMFLDTHVTFPGIKYIVPIGPLTLVAAVEKRYEYNDGQFGQSDKDNDVYDLGAIYKFGAGDAGLMYQFANNRSNRSSLATSNTTQIHVLNPYVKAKFGSVYVEAEGVYGFGKLENYENAGAGTDIEASAWGAYVHAKADVGPGYVGGMIAYLSGDDPNTADKREGTMAYALLAGQAWDPCLILFNDGIYGSSHRVRPATGTAGMFFDNASLYQLYAGFKPVKAADIKASFTYAQANQLVAVSGAYPYGGLSKDIGWEIDLTAKYKIFDNLEYMIGGGYVGAGDYFKTATNPVVDNNYMIFHRLTMNF